ncbi:MAG: NAD(P)/FAD-dependent oxidoreductase [Rhodoferax sp.]|uniref:NAD(P)/FAD-dependent oxidoreductase n=1 Tax=Rhodoferax sp. TaxID=50421 RepID=UPI00260D8232|nr:NAD(P)/FAD-dependent oxidoreductase [Rhodoferax sp.]MDD5333305.1 NAD(P)/FAD-dependent oxidoreductase [Rhodoferax sp.]
MIRLTELKLGLEHSAEDLNALIHSTLAVTAADVAQSSIFKRSIDARKAELRVVYIVDVELSPGLEATLLAKFSGNPHIFAAPDLAYHPVAQAPINFGPRPVVVGFGPCGIFAALILAQAGFKPIVLERGKTVRERTQDTWGLWRKRELNPESNVQFGEGGAGTFSDGKLYSQIKDPRHLGRKVMNEFVKAGAPPEILVDAHPHIGTFKLVKVVENLRQQIIALGGEIRFQQRVTDVLIEGAADDRQLRGLTVLNQASGESYELPAEQVVLALGHSSRDTFAMLYRRGVAMEAKPFSIGFRIEHPQSLIDRARWGRHAGHPKLGAADYKLVHHASNGRSVYSFCMCPGGTVVAATSEIGRVVTNGMSQYSRNERNANAGIVVGIEPSDYPSDAAAFHATLGDQVPSQLTPGMAQHPLAGIVLQRQLESNAYVLGGANYDAPGQLLGDFLAGRASTQLGEVEPSYKPGVELVDLGSALPGYAIDAIRQALPAFGHKIKGFDRPDAVLTGVETRTSSPLKMPRGEDFQSSNTRGLYPAGEGASYAGGILSAGVDGIKVAEALARNLLG